MRAEYGKKGDRQRKKRLQLCVARDRGEAGKKSCKKQAENSWNRAQQQLAGRRLGKGGGTVQAPYST